MTSNQYQKPRCFFIARGGKGPQYQRYERVFASEEILATVHNLLSLDLRTNFPKGEDGAECSTEAKYRRFALDDVFQKICSNDDEMRLCTVAIWKNRMFLLPVWGCFAI